MVGYNNPFNIRSSNRNAWLGQQSCRKGFCNFVSPVYGIRAFFVLMSNYAKDGDNTIRKIVTRFAPPSENNTDDYIDFVSGYVGINPDTPLIAERYEDLAMAMARFEGNPISRDGIKYVLYSMALHLI